MNEVLAVHDVSNFYPTHSDSRRVFEFQTTLARTPLLCRPQVQRPTGVCLLPDGNVAVADYDNKWVSVFDPASGKFVSRIGHGKLLGPKGVAVNGQGHLVVVDNKASAVLVFQPGSGKLLHKFGSRGAEQV